MSWYSSAFDNEVSVEVSDMIEIPRFELEHHVHEIVQHRHTCHDGSHTKLTKNLYGTTVKR